MRNQLKSGIFLTFLCFFTQACTTNPAATSVQNPAYSTILDSLRAVYAPDQRTTKFRPEIIFNGNDPCPVIKGMVTDKRPARAMRRVLSELDLCYFDSLRILPDPVLGADTFGIVNVSVANLRTQAKHSGELTTQVLLGMPLRVLDKDDHWYLVQTPERYIAWLDEGAFVRGNRAMLQNYYQQSLAMVNEPLLAASSLPTGGEQLRDLSSGGLVVAGEKLGQMQSVLFPDGRRGYVPASALIELKRMKDRAQKLETTLLARQFYGAPYLWGGTSAKGMDCSGFTKMSFLMNGYVIPRDASQQVHVGTEVPLSEDLVDLEKGDLLFFGNLRTDGSQRITHVGFYLGGGRFVHAGASNGYIREESLFPESDDYAPDRRASLLRVKRFEIGSPGVLPLLELISSFSGN
jgi:hypothetical protein